jgi:hypothetical protein
MMMLMMRLCLALGTTAPCSLFRIGLWHFIRRTNFNKLQQTSTNKQFAKNQYKTVSKKQNFSHSSELAHATVTASSLIEVIDSKQIEFETSVIHEQNQYWIPVGTGDSQHAEMKRRNPKVRNEPLPNSRPPASCDDDQESDAVCDTATSALRRIGGACRPRLQQQKASSRPRRT